MFTIGIKTDFHLVNEKKDRQIMWFSESYMIDHEMGLNSMSPDIYGKAVCTVVP